VAFAITPVAAKDGNQTTISGGVDFIDTSGTGVGPWIIGKCTFDPAGVNVQYVLSNNAAKCDISSIGGTNLSGASALPVTGTFWQATQPVSLTQLNGVALGSPSNYGTSPGTVPVIGVNAYVTNSLATTSASTTTSTVTSTAYSSLTSSATINTSVSGCVQTSIYNNINAPLYVLVGGNGTASTTNFTLIMPAGSFYECPANFTGTIVAIQANASSGAVLVTQLTP
jgi:hypothetical protein